MSKQRGAKAGGRTGKPSDRLTTGPKKRVAALHAAGFTTKQIMQATGLSDSYVRTLIRLPAVKAESERLFMLWFNALMDRQCGDIPPHPGVPE